MTTQYHSLALDLDGTLLNETGQLEPHVAKLLLEAQNRGIGVHLVSGRMHPTILPFWEQIGLNTPIVSYNGAKIQKPGEKPLFERFIEPALAKEIIEYSRERDLCLNIYFEDHLYALKENPNVVWYSDYFGIPWELYTESSWPENGAPVKLLMIVADPGQMTTLEAEVKERFSSGTHITTSSGRFVEFLPDGVNKAAGLAKLSELEGKSLQNWVAVGDGMNDYEMLKECGVGLAVENAPDELKSKIDRTVPSLPKGGIEKVLQEFFGFCF